jgi:hypothetical protein
MTFHEHTVNGVQFRASEKLDETTLELLLRSGALASVAATAASGLFPLACVLLRPVRQIDDDDPIGVLLGLFPLSGTADENLEVLEYAKRLAKTTEEYLCSGPEEQWSRANVYAFSKTFAPFSDNLTQSNTH